jgi:hypothetical protein
MQHTEDTTPEIQHLGGLDEATIERIAELTAQKAIAKMTDEVYKSVGKGLVQKLFWVVGALGTGFALWLNSNGNFPKGH